MIANMLLPTNLKNISEEIDKYFAVMPKTNTYSIYRQKDTKAILEYVHRTLKRLKPHHTMLPELQKNINAISRWDDAVQETEDLAFQLLLDKIKKDLRQIKTLASI
jgi:hypothetical protein